MRCLSESIPPANLPPKTQSKFLPLKYFLTSSTNHRTPSVPVLVIGCGSHQPIDTYAARSASQYPIYTDPTLRLHAIFKFKSNLAEGKSGDEKRDYMRSAGSAMSRVWGGVKGALGHLEHVNYVGPKALNGGEVLVSAGELCLC